MLNRQQLGEDGLQTELGLTGRDDCDNDIVDIWQASQNGSDLLILWLHVTRRGKVVTKRCSSREILRERFAGQQAKFLEFSPELDDASLVPGAIGLRQRVPKLLCGAAATHQR
jgi:hypothetical protein